jgi:hypothetical protein
MGWRGILALFWNFAYWWTMRTPPALWIGDRGLEIGDWRSGIQSEYARFITDSGSWGVAPGWYGAAPLALKAQTFF